MTRFTRIIPASSHLALSTRSNTPLITFRERERERESEPARERERERERSERERSIKHALENLALEARP